MTAAGSLLTEDLVPRLAGMTVVVVGDVFLDEYLVGRAERLSREAPVPVLEFEERQLVPGGGANPAANIASLGSRPVLLSAIGEDAAASELARALEERRIDPSKLIRSPERPTSVKMRVVARTDLRSPQQLARLDRVDRQPLLRKVEGQVVRAIRSALPDAHALLLSDYRSGLCTPVLVDAARSAARKNGLVLTADSQGDLDKYRGFTLVKCNQAEAEAYLGRELPDDQAHTQASQGLLDRLELQAMLITRGAAGLTLAARPAGVLHLPAANVTDVFDATGAGDTVIAVATLALAAGLAPETAATLANAAAGVAVRHLGNHPVTTAELQQAVQGMLG